MTTVSTFPRSFPDDDGFNLGDLSTKVVALFIMLFDGTLTIAAYLKLVADRATEVWHIIHPVGT